MKGLNLQAEMALKLSKMAIIREAPKIFWGSS